MEIAVKLDELILVFEIHVERDGFDHAFGVERFNTFNAVLSESDFQVFTHEWIRVLLTDKERMDLFYKHQEKACKKAEETYAET